VNGSWQLAYVLQDGLEIGIPYDVPDYPAGISPATGGCRNLTGEVHRDGIVDIYAVTSTISASGDQGADPNKLVKVSDLLKATTPQRVSEGSDRNGRLGHFVMLRAAKAGEVLRGVAFAPRKEERDREH
jgi:hypothetical protein